MENIAEPMTLVRPAAVSDIARLLEMYRELDETHQLQHPQLFPPAVERDAARVERMLADPKVGIFVATLPSVDPAIGFVRVVDVQTPDGGVLLPRRFGLVDELVVMPEHRRAGVANALLVEVEAWARQRGIGALEVTVWAFNHSARELYAKEGFSILRHYLRKSLA
jgi:GNAT superfamily N-acetyltransferase